MNKIFRKENIKPIAVLVIISLIVALLLGAVNLLTSPEIERRKQEAVDAAFKDVLPNGSEFEAIALTADYPKEIKAAHKAKGGYVFQLDTYGYKAMTLMVGVDDDGKVAGVKVITDSESADQKSWAFPVLTGENSRYNGKTADTLEKETVTGATATSTGIYNAVKAALDGYTVASGGELAAERLPRTDAEIIALAETLLGAQSGTLTDVTPEEGLTNVKRIYRSADKKNYAVYTLVISQYGTPETETLVNIGSDGKIKGINKLVWKTSDAMHGYEPPTQEQADAFYATLSDKDMSHLATLKELSERIIAGEEGAVNNGELVTKATQTTDRLLGALIEAMEQTDKLVKADMPTAEEQVIAKAEALLGAQAGTLTNVTPDEELDYIKRIYRSADKKSYAVYTVVMSQYGTPETETLVHIGSDGKIKGIEKMTWKTSDAMYGYEPPTQEQADTFYKSLVGTNFTQLKELKVLAEKCLSGEAEHNGVLVTKATQTTDRLLAALIEAMEQVKELVWKDTPTEESIIIASAAELLGTKAASLTDVTPDNTEFVKRVYRDDKLGYAVYTVVINERYGRVETETLVHIGFDGKIEAVKKMTWKTSDAGWGYEPPTQEQADAFYKSLVGTNVTQLEELKVLAEKCLAGEAEHNGVLVTKGTSTTQGLLVALIEGMNVVDGFDYQPANATLYRVLAISVMALAVGGFVAYLIVPRIIRRRREG